MANDFLTLRVKSDAVDLEVGDAEGLCTHRGRPAEDGIDASE